MRLLVEVTMSSSPTGRRGGTAIGGSNKNTCDCDSCGRKDNKDRMSLRRRSGCRYRERSLLPPATVNLNFGKNVEKTLSLPRWCSDHNCDDASTIKRKSVLVSDDIVTMASRQSLSTTGTGGTCDFPKRHMKGGGGQLPQRRRRRNNGSPSSSLLSFFGGGGGNDNENTKNWGDRRNRPTTAEKQQRMADNLTKRLVAGETDA